MASSLTTNAEFAKQFFKSKGWTDAQAAGIVGNLQAESGPNLNIGATNGNALGIAQWLKDRQAIFKAQYGFPLDQATLNQQLEFVNWELNNNEKAAGQALKATNTAADAARVVMEKYERPGNSAAELGRRVAFAQTLSGGIPEGALSAGPTPASEASNTDGGGVYVINMPPIPNRLHNYSSYIYSLSLHMMTNEQYDQIVTTQKYTPTNVIIASAGRHSANFQRNKNWTLDFYFDEFNLETIICPNDESRNTNGINCDFTIIEPYGFTMVERILQTTAELGGKNYLDMPYLVQIDFFALDDSGEIRGAIPELQKRFPIKFNKLDIRITERGAEYKINATPYGHEAFKGAAVTVPANMEVTARTVKDFFQSIEGTAADSYAQELFAKAELQQRETTYKNQNTSSLLYNSAGQSSVINVDSFGNAINAYYKGMKDANKCEIADIYRFEFLPDPKTGADVFGKATFVEDKRNTPKETPMKKNDNSKDTVSMKLADAGSSQNIYDASRGIWSINYGSTIDKLLEYVIRNSTYIFDQLVLPDGLSSEEYKARKEALKDKPLKWFRIIPRVRLLGYDSIRKLWAKEYTYTVKPYEMYNVRTNIAPQGVAVTPVKNYDYIFTGKNSDILSLDIIFNNLFYDQQTSNRANMSKENITGDSLSEDYRFQNAPNFAGGEPPMGVNYDAVMPLVMRPVVANPRAVATGNPSDVMSVGAADLAESIMSSSEADMTNIKMSILGDPDYIKQDDVFYGATPVQEFDVSTQIDPRLLPDGGSLRMDDSGVYIQVLFKIPRDIDEGTGFMSYEANQRNSVFSGLYMVVSVNSSFSRGQFTQTLNLTRLPRQVAFDYVGNSSNNKSDQRPGSDTTKTTPVKSITGGPGTSSASATDTAVDQTAGQDQQAAIANTDIIPSILKSQQNLAAVRAAGNTTTINDQNAPQEVPLAPKF